MSTLWSEHPLRRSSHLSSCHEIELMEDNPAEQRSTSSIKGRLLENVPAPSSHAYIWRAHHLRYKPAAVQYGAPHAR